MWGVLASDLLVHPQDIILPPEKNTGVVYYITRTLGKETESTCDWLQHPQWRGQGNRWGVGGHPEKEERGRSHPTAEAIFEQRAVLWSLPSYITTSYHVTEVLYWDSDPKYECMNLPRKSNATGHDLILEVVSPFIKRLLQLTTRELNASPAFDLTS